MAKPETDVGTDRPRLGAYKSIMWNARAASVASVYSAYKQLNPLEIQHEVHFVPWRLGPLGLLLPGSARVSGASARICDTIGAPTGAVGSARWPYHTGGRRHLRLAQPAKACHLRPAQRLERQPHRLCCPLSGHW